ncbi:hypothetical protein BGZ98_006574 [Dissophora globulifera]|nr:hypothetical protein BGZ98_006574 [Dissophora globulifera]
MVGIWPASQSQVETPLDTSNGNISIALEDLDERGISQDQRRPGLHGRARIWGPTKSIRMILLTTALMGYVAAMLLAYPFLGSVEMAYGTPFLLQLGLSKPLMSLVWLAGPLSVQASCRTLIVDSLPSSQQEAAASWASRLMGIGGIFGYFMGNVNLPQRVPAFGDTQIKGLAIIACLFLILTVGLTCVTVTERIMVRPPKTSKSSFDEFLESFRTIFRAIRYLPTRIQHLCNVQFFAWMGWFPFLFYSSTYVAEIYTREMSENGAPVDPEQDQVSGIQDAAVRAGSFCLLIYSIVSLGASILLPLFVTPAEHVVTEPSGPFSNSRTTASENSHSGLKRLSKWRSLQLPRWMKLPIQGLTLPRMYTLSLALVSFSLVSTWYIHDLRGTTILFAGCGIAWAMSMWAPFSILGEVISQQMQEEQHQERTHDIGSTQRSGSSEVLFRKSEDEDDGDTEEIRMAESSHGRKYQPLRVRESLEDAITVGESSFMTSWPTAQTRVSSDSFRHSTRTPSPTVVEGQPSPAAPVGWTVSSDHDTLQHRLNIDSDTDVTSDDDDEALPKKHVGEEEQRLVQDRGGRSRPSRPSRSRSHSDSYQPNPIIESNSNTRGIRSQTQERRDSSGYTAVDTAGRPSSQPRGSEPSSATRQASSSSTSSPSEGASAGALLGIHNIYIVLPQFLVSFLSSLVFAAIEPKPDGGIDGDVDQPGDPETIGVMLRIGGVMAGIAAVLSLKLWTQPRTVAPLHHI